MLENPYASPPGGKISSQTELRDIDQKPIYIEPWPRRGPTYVLV